MRHIFNFWQTLPSVCFIHSTTSCTQTIRWLFRPDIVVTLIITNLRWPASHSTWLVLMSCWTHSKLWKWELISSFTSHPIDLYTSSCAPFHYHPLTWSQHLLNPQSPIKHSLLVTTEAQRLATNPGHTLQVSREGTGVLCHRHICFTSFSSRSMDKLQSADLPI